jgi:hypothetical protein
VAEVTLALAIQRPMPPQSLLEAVDDVFIPAPEVEAWLRTSFLDEQSPLYNVEHDHLNSARLGVLWTNAANVRQMMPVAGMVELPKPHPALGKWGKARHEHQLRVWFGTAELDFLITLYAPYCAEATDILFCALVEHELYHCAHRLDAFGFPEFYKSTGLPKFAIKGHDVEEHVGVVRRYGIGSAAGSSRAFLVAALNEPEVGEADIAGVCGTCR